AGRRGGESWLGPGGPRHRDLSHGGGCHRLRASAHLCSGASRRGRSHLPGRKPGPRHLGMGARSAARGWRATGRRARARPVRPRCGTVTSGHVSAGPEPAARAAPVAAEVWHGDDVVLVQDWIGNLGGAETVLRELASLFPQAPILTLFAMPETVRK